MLHQSSLTRYYIHGIKFSNNIQLLFTGQDCGLSSKFSIGCFKQWISVGDGQFIWRKHGSNTDMYVWVHDPSNIQKCIVSGDLPEKGVNYGELYKQDRTIAKKLGLNAYRIRIEWSRIFPKSASAVEVRVKGASDGSISKIEVDESALENLEKIADKDAASHYRNVIEDLRLTNLKYLYAGTISQCRYGFIIQ